MLERLQGIPVSIDTSKAEVARRALELGAVMVNDVTALRGDPDAGGRRRRRGRATSASCTCSASRGRCRTTRATTTSSPRSVASSRTGSPLAVEAGIPEERICLDPGIGFGKTVEHNLELLARLDELVALGRPVLVGASRKRFLGRILGDPDALTGPVSAGVAVAVLAFERGASLFRVHDVREHVEALAAAQAVVAR